MVKTLSSSPCARTSDVEQCGLDRQIAPITLLLFYWTKSLLLSESPYSANNHFIFVKFFFSGPPDSANNYFITSLVQQLIIILLSTYGLPNCVNNDFTMYFIEASSVLPDGAINYAHLQHYHQVNWRQSSFQVIFVNFSNRRKSWKRPFHSQR